MATLAILVALNSPVLRATGAAQQWRTAGNWCAVVQLTQVNKYNMRADETSRQFGRTNGGCAANGATKDGKLLGGRPGHSADRTGACPCPFRARRMCAAQCMQAGVWHARTSLTASLRTAGEVVRRRRAAQPRAVMVCAQRQ